MVEAAVDYAQTGRLPYVITADVGGLMRAWGRSAGFTVPNQEFFDGLARDTSDVLQGFFSGEVITLGEQELRKGLSGLIKESTYPVVSLDRAYVSTSNPKIVGFIDATRAVGPGPDFKDLGLRPRPGTPPLDAQIQKIVDRTEGPITLLDDVLYTGGGALDLATRFAAKGRPVRQFIGAVTVAMGADLLRANNIEVKAVEAFGELVDEVCLRDMFALVPMSGRTVIDGEEVYSAPYFDPVGKPRKWASIPDNRATYFSAYCLQQSSSIWGKVEQLSRLAVGPDVVPRKLKDMVPNASVLATLQYHQAALRTAVM